jgi:hypothetical protein
MIVGNVAWFFVGGDQASELQRLDRLLIVLLAVHGLRTGGYVIESVCLFQLITGASVTLSVTDWTPTAATLLTAFVQARASHER